MSTPVVNPPVAPQATDEFPPVKWVEPTPRPTCRECALEMHKGEQEALVEIPPCPIKVHVVSKEPCQCKYHGKWAEVRAKKPT